MCLWGVFVWGGGVLFLACVCVFVSGVLFPVGVCVCDLLICLHCDPAPLHQVDVAFTSGASDIPLGNPTLNVMLLPYPTPHMNEVLYDITSPHCDPTPLHRNKETQSSGLTHLAAFNTNGICAPYPRVDGFFYF